MDLVNEEKRDDIFEKRKEQLQQKCSSSSFKVNYFSTNIWDPSLNKAWNEILNSLVSNNENLKKGIKELTENTQVDETIVFEKNTFAIICSYNSKTINDNLRFEKMSYFFKKLKKSCFNNDYESHELIINHKNFCAYIDEYTKGTYIMMVFDNKKINLEMIKLNIRLSKDDFLKMICKKS